MAISSAPKRMLWVSPEMYPEPGGIGNQTAYLARHLVPLGYSLSVLADTSLISKAEAEAFDARQAYGVRRIFRRRQAWITYWARIGAMVRGVRRHETIVCSGKWPIWLGGLLSYLWPRRQWVAVVHGSELDLTGQLGRWWMNQSLARFQKIVAVSSYTAKHLPAFKGAKPPKVQVIGNGIEPADFVGVGVNGYARSAHGNPALITVGSVKERKGQRRVIEAMPRILKQYPKAKYHVVGLPHEVPALRALADSLGLNGSVTFHGLQSRESVQHLLKASDVFLLPSQHTTKGDFEGYGIAILEANALGIPAIASLQSGSKDAVTPESGVLVDDATPEALTSALQTILSQSERFAQGAQRFSETRTWAKVALAYHQFLAN